MKKTLSLSHKQSRSGYIFTLPLMIGGVLMFLPMIFMTIGISVSMEQGFTFAPALFGNYKGLVKNIWFIQTGLQSLLNVLIDFILILVFSFFIASLLNQKFVGRTLARIIFFLPIIVATGVISKVESESFYNLIGTNVTVSLGDMNGLSNFDLTSILNNSALNPAIVSFLTATVSRIYDITIASGVQILIFLAGFQSVPAHLYEAAYVEGCTGWEAFWKITLPMISPLILVNAVYSFIDATTKSTNPIMTQIVRETTQGNFGLSSTMAIVYLLASSVIMGLVFFIISRFVYYQN